MSAIVVDSVKLVSELVDCIFQCPFQPPLIFVDLEGIQLSRHGSISIIQVLVPPSPKVYLVDVHTLSDKSFSSLGRRGSTLKSILESEEIPKIFFDVRRDSDALYSHFGIDLHCVIDLQLLEFTTRRVPGQFLQGLSKCISEDPGLSSDEALESKKIKDAGIRLFLPEKGGSYDVFNKRPLDPAIQNYCVLDALVMPKLLKTYASKLQSRLASQIHSATLSRIALSQSLNFDSRGQHMARGPTISRNRYLSFRFLETCSHLP